MIKYIKSNNNWKEIKNSCRITTGKEETEKEPSSEFKKRIIMSEHSPIRMLNVIWLWEGIKSWISVHFVRHKIGIDHFVKTQRDDRTGEDRNSKRQDSLVNHKCYANAQALISISRKRLCRKSHSETRTIWTNFLIKLRETEPELESRCVCECIYRNGLCPEIESCGYNKTLEFEEQLKIYIKGFENQINKNTLIKNIDKDSNP